MDIDGEDLSPRCEDITLSHVSFSYDSKPILRDVSLTVPEKTTVAIVGPSGSGKSTLCNLMAGSGMCRAAVSASEEKMYGNTAMTA